MQLTAQQEALVRAWAAEGASLSDIQTRLADECGVKLSYLDTRFLLIDLKVDLAEKPEKKPVADPLASGAPAGGAAGAGGAFGPEDGLDPYDPTSGAPEDYGDPADASDPPDSAVPADPPDSAAPAAGSVQVDLDRIQRPGFAASGSIVCSDGTKGEWGIDSYGRIALAFPEKKGYRPSPSDQQAFMQRLQTLLGGY